jgi:HAD superfamily hydrolase (TIGR01509 family)
VAPPAALLDLDGTLVDTNYHHALAWYRAFRQFGVVLPMWRIHRHVGMGGDQLVPTLAGDEFEREHGDEARAAENVLYKELIPETEPLEGARELVEELKRRGHAVVLASSSKADDLEHYLELLGVRHTVDAWTDADDVESSKPEPDLVHAALEKAGTGPDNAVFVGDTRWDIDAAAKADVPTIAVVTGGWAEQELRDAGAVCVFDSIPSLVEGLDSTPLAGSP